MLLMTLNICLIYQEWISHKSVELLQAPYNAKCLNDISKLDSQTSEYNNYYNTYHKWVIAQRAVHVCCTVASSGAAGQPVNGIHTCTASSASTVYTATAN